MNTGTKTDRINAFISGILFIIATIAAIIGLKLYDPILNPIDYLARGTQYSNQIITGAVLELIVACTVAGTGIMLFPYLKKFNENLAVGYIVFRSFEAVFILLGIVSVLALLSLSHAYTKAAVPDSTMYEVTGKTLQAIHDWTFILGPNFMLGINTFIYSYTFYHTNLIPEKIAVIGIIGSILILIAALLEMFGIILQLSVWGVLLAIPIFLYEMILAVWLIVNGFNLDFLNKNCSK